MYMVCIGALIAVCCSWFSKSWLMMIGELAWDRVDALVHSKEGLSKLLEFTPNLNLIVIDGQVAG